MRISDHISLEAILLSPAVSSSEALLQQLVELACSVYHIARPEEVLALVRAREHKLSTAIGQGLAVPHAKCDHVPEIRVAVATLPSGLQWASPDRKPVRLAFLLLSPTGGAGVHVRALSAISHIKPDLRDLLLGCPSPQAFLQALSQAEAAREK